ncbi:hypothetical protein HY440_03530 [Candidatus Microgenomates bacterium]|nr:hypothetical protein [Candidatus Microgenomates bacterium]
MLQKLKNYWHLLESVAAAIFYRFPGKKLTVIGVTGTDGKTTTTTLLHHILTMAGIKAGVSSTLFSPHTTTPGRWRTQKFLAQSLNNGCTHAVLEVTSIAIDQYRVWGINFAIGVLTNIADHEHLDYHKTFAAYRATKLGFLASCRQQVDAAKLSPRDFKKILTASKLPGEFNAQNVMAASAAARLLGIDDATIIKAVASFKLPSGRLEIVAKKPFTVIVDFAHTPQAFSAVLPVAKKMGKRLIHVFGATGNRDKDKRPIMAQIAAEYDDFIVLTHEDTYSEDPKAIIAQLEAGLAAVNYQTYGKAYDRREAIEAALKEAKPGDVVILTGVGHQKSMNLAGREVPWSDQKTVLELLEHRE